MALSTVKKNIGEGADVALKCLPKDLFEADAFMAGRVLIKAFSIISLGFLFLAEPVLIPIGVLLVGIGMTFLYLVGYECSQLSFFKSYTANMVTRVLAWAPLLTSVEGDRIGSWLACLAPVVVIGALCLYMGFVNFVTAFLKYWLLPMIIMHINIKNSAYGQKQYNKAVSLLFPELAGDGNLIDALAKVPFYKLDRALEVLNVKVADTRDRVGGFFSLLSFPSNYWMTEMLFWNKRDVLIELSLAIAAILLPLQYYSYVHPATMALPLLLLVLGFTKNSRGTALLGRSFVNFGLNSLKNATSSWSTGKPHWFNIFYIGGVHVWGLLALFLAVPYAKWQTLVFGIGMFHVLYGFGITVGCHRLWSHKSFEASFPVRLFLIIMATGANQGSIWHWVRDHRVHHRYSDTDTDPHNANNGFWFSHFGWLMVQKNEKVVKAGRDMDMSDIEADKIIMFQRRYYPLLAIFMAFVVPTAFCCILFGENWLISLSVCYLRYCIILNATWCVNSVAHFFGYRPYRPDSPPAETLLVSILAVGEGWHNYHHAYPFDYATSEFGVMGQWNPSKAFIDVCHFFGLVSNLKRANHLGKKARERNGWMNSNEYHHGPVAVEASS